MACSKLQSILRLLSLRKFMYGFTLKVDSIAKAVCAYVRGVNFTSVSDEHLLTFRAEVDDLEYLNGISLNLDGEKDLRAFSLELGIPIEVILISDRENCRKCNWKLCLSSEWKPVVVYDQVKGTILGCRLTKWCKKCKINEHYGYFTSGGNRQFNSDCLSFQYLLSTEDTAFDMKILKYYDSELVLGATPFSLEASVYNVVHGYSSSKAQLNVVEMGDSSCKPRNKRMKRYGIEIVFEGCYLIGMHTCNVT